MRKYKQGGFFSKVWIVLIAGLFMGLLLPNCAKQVTRQSETSVTSTGSQKTARLDYAKKIKKDTLSYVIQFPDTAERTVFAQTLEKMIKSFPSRPAGDSGDGFFIKAQAVVPKQIQQIDSGKSLPNTAAFQQMQMEPVKKPENATARFGGSVTIFTPYSGPDPLLFPLITASPFVEALGGGKDQVAKVAFCEIKAVSNKKISIALTPSARNALGKVFSAFDVVTLLSAYIKQHPAEGRALFRYVSGIDQFIAGREAMLPGFLVLDEKTIVLQLSQPDSQAVDRLATARLFPASFKAGPYAIQGEKNNTLFLLPNPNFPNGKPFLNTCNLRLGKDNNPFLSFSLNRYDIMVIFFQKDADYVRRAFAEKAFLKPCPGKRYFLALGLQSADQRSALWGLIDRKDILVNYVKAEGRILSSIESSDESVDGTMPTAPTPPAPTIAAAPSGFGTTQLTILSRMDDPVSVIIAEKLLADFTRAGLFCTIKSVSLEDYEKSLIKRDFSVAVGFAPESVIKDKSEKLRMATMWFNDENSERSRIEQKQELPLFSITTYLLCKNRIAFVNDVIEGVYVKE